MRAPGSGLTSEQVELARNGAAKAVVRARGGRTYGQIARANVFTFYNNLLFVIGVALLAMDRLNDAFVSVGLGLLNAVISSVQEMRAKRKLDALKLLHRTHARVIRQGVERELPSAELVIGDLIRVVAGDQVLVDGPVEGSGRLEVDESLLTGESEAVVKIAGDRMLSGSFIVAGEGYQLADAVGAQSHAQAVTSAAQRWTSIRTPLQRQIDLVVRAVILTVLLMSAAILGQAALEGLPLVRVVQTSAVLSGLVPYGLFFLVTVAYSVAAATIAESGALVQQVNAVESLSNVDIVCTDKTGTLTTGRLQLQTVHRLTRDLADDQLAHLVGTVARSATAANATTAALVESLPGSQSGLAEEVLFSSARRWSGVSLAEAEGTRRAFVLGAVQALISSMPIEAAADGSELLAAVESYTVSGLRVLVFAQAAEPDARLTDGSGHPALPALVPLALVVLSDELRPYVRETLADLRDIGVAVKVVSGDDPATVAALVAQVGLRDDEPVSGAELTEMGPELFDRVVQQRSVFGRIGPEQKERIVDSLIRAGHYVAMIGDGVNDIRSLKRAQVGVAMQSGSSVARDVADLVLLGDSFAALPAARREGQRVIGGLSTALKLFLSRIAISMLIIIAVGILGLGFPYEPAQVALTFFTVGLPSVLLTLWARPQRLDPHLIADVARFVVPVAIVTGVFAVGLYAALSTLLTDALEQSMLPSSTITQFEEFTGLARTDSGFVAATSTGVAQTGLSMFTSVTAFVLVLFLEPPARFFTGWAPVRADKRPAVLVVALLAVFAVLLSVPQAASYFGLLQPGGFMIPLVTVATVVWFVTLRASWRHQLLQRALGLSASDTAEAPALP